MIEDFVYRETWYRGISKEVGAAEVGTFTKPLMTVMIFSLFFLIGEVMISVRYPFLISSFEPLLSIYICI